MRYSIFITVAHIKSMNIFQNFKSFISNSILLTVAHIKNVNTFKYQEYEHF